MDLVESLIQILDRRLQLFTRLDGLSVRQSSRIEVEDYDGLLAIVAEREEVIADIVAMDSMRELESWPDVMAVASPTQREVIDSQIDRLSELESSVASRDESDLQALEARRVEMSRQMRGVDTGRSALGAYARGTGGEPVGAKFQDHNV